VKLYYINGQWQLPGQQDKHAERINIPTDPFGLRAFLTEHGVRLGQPAEPAPPPASDEAAAPVSPPATDIQSIEEFILDHATQAQIEQLIMRLATRFGETIRAARPNA
jgi:hypothetical protein